MRFLILLKSNLKRMIRSKSTIIATFVIPCFIVLGFGVIFNKIIGNTDNDFIVVNSDRGSNGSEFIKEIKTNTKIEVYDKAKAEERLKRKNIGVFYEIPEDFSEKLAKGEKPQIAAYKLESNKDLGNFQLNANTVINHMVLRSEFKNNNKEISLKDLSYEDTKISVVSKDKSNFSIGESITLNLIISFVLYSSIGISMELFHLGEQNIITRSFTTGNKPKVILGAILISLFLISVVSYSVIYTLSALISSPSMLLKAPVAILNLSCLALVSLSLGILVSRLVKNESYINVTLQAISAITCFLGGSFMPYELLPKSITVFSKFTPQYWAIQSINNQKPQYALIVVLFALVLFTAGTFKTKSIANA
ncbi:ABC transporter permease [Clostridium sp. C8-1-8]|uniref:ABC transporter permease n=1 Tax=Clostridium sp. C8-1-8 TaxID=2698831 RepID=UPI00136A95AF|nr:ABC transporter permease [Clostridium sp. C8-1-8]